MMNVSPGLHTHPVSQVQQVVSIATGNPLRLRRVSADLYSLLQPALHSEKNQHFEVRHSYAPTPQQQPTTSKQNTRTHPHGKPNRFERAKSYTAASHAKLRKTWYRDVRPVIAHNRKVVQSGPFGPLFEAEVACGEAHEDAMCMGDVLLAARTALQFPAIDCDYGSLLAAEKFAGVAYSASHGRFQSALRHVQAVRAVAPKGPGYGGCDGSLLQF